MTVMMSKEIQWTWSS